ncbi:DUF6214 family protein [Streptomyces sp. NPDC056149]|uniref:DUF6214 family protein n=1 Tax=Streptomyces sp. NPDC056149 TaxID=3345728 RepID=UPI0035E0D1CC
MSESEFYTDNHRYKAQGGASEWPDWELQAHGSAASELGPWFSARLTFPHGARIDVLVTATGDHLTVEDVRADPPLTLDALAALAHWIDGPLDDACRAATGRPPKSAPASEAPAAPEGGDGPARPREADPHPPPAGEVVHGEGALCGTGAGTEPRAGTADGAASGATVEAAADEPSGPATAADGRSEADATPDREPDVAARSTVLVRSRAGERRKIAAAAYRAAQQEGQDPVLAVMNATGRNRRRALRLIAGARDAGLLTPRHNKR